MKIEALTRYDEMFDEAAEYDAEKPEVWKFFCQFTFELIARGFKRNSVAGVFERIRWECDIPNSKGRTTFKINNNHYAFYARWFMEDNPEYAKFFGIRHQKSMDQPARGLSPLGPENYPEA